jgi:hypothetical protein
MFLDLFGYCPDSPNHPVKCRSGNVCTNVSLFCMKLIRPTRRIDNPVPICALISFAGILSGGSPERVHTVSLLCPPTIPAPFGHWLMPVNVFRSLWKLPGLPGQSRIMPFRKRVYECTPFLHEIDPAQPPDWQSGPELSPDLSCRDTVRGIPGKSPYSLPPLPQYDPGTVRSLVNAG